MDNSQKRERLEKLYFEYKKNQSAIIDNVKIDLKFEKEELDKFYKEQEILKEKIKDQ